MFFSLKRTKFYLSFDWDLSLVSEFSAMSTNKERIENLEASFGDLQTKFDRMEVGFCHTPIPSLTRLADPNRVQGARPYTRTLYLLYQTLVCPSLITVSK